MQPPPVLWPAVTSATATTTASTAVTDRTPPMSHRSRTVSRRWRSVPGAGPLPGIGLLLTLVLGLVCRRPRLVLIALLLLQLAL